MAVKDIYRLNYPVDQSDLVDQVNRILQRLMDRLDGSDVTQSLESYTSDPVSASYATFGAAEEIASSTDLNSLRAAVENLRIGFEDLRTKLIAYGIVT